MKHKGFTVVEVSIVLVIMGIILGLGIKGKSLIESAKIRKEVMTLPKVKLAFSEYQAKNGSIPVDNKGNVNTVTMIESGVLSANEISTTRTVGGKYTFRAIMLNKGKFGIVHNPLTRSNKFAMSIRYNETPFMCYVENIIDDRNVYGGDMVTYTGSQTDTKADVKTKYEMNYDDCKNVKPLTEGSISYRVL